MNSNLNFWISRVEPQPTQNFPAQTKSEGQTNGHIVTDLKEALKGRISTLTSNKVVNTASKTSCFVKNIFNFFKNIMTCFEIKSLENKVKTLERLEELEVGKFDEKAINTLKKIAKFADQIGLRAPEKQPADLNEGNLHEDTKSELRPESEKTDQEFGSPGDPDEFQQKLENPPVITNPETVLNTSKIKSLNEDLLGEKEVQRIKDFFTENKPLLADKTNKGNTELFFSKLAKENFIPKSYKQISSLIIGEIFTQGDSKWLKNQIQNLHENNEFTFAFQLLQTGIQQTGMAWDLPTYTLMELIELFNEMSEFNEELPQLALEVLSRYEWPIAIGAFDERDKIPKLIEKFPEELNIVCKYFLDFDSVKTKDIQWKEACIKNIQEFGVDASKVINKFDKEPDPKRATEKLQGKMLFLATVKIYCNTHNIDPKLLKGEMELYLKSDNSLHVRRGFKIMLCQMAKDGSLETIQSWKKNPNGKNYPTHLELPLLYLNGLKQGGVNTDGILDTIHSKKSESGNLFFKGLQPQHALLRALKVIHDDRTITPEQKRILLDKILDSSSNDEIKAFLGGIESITLLKGNLALLFKKDSGLNHIKTSIDSCLCELFQKQISIGKIEDFAVKYERLIEKFEKPKLLIKYAALLKASKYQCEGEAVLKSAVDAYATFFTELLEDTFHDNRYENSPHLEQVFANQADTKTKWKNGEKRGLFETTVETPLFPNARLVDSDDPYDIFSCGEEANSCLKISDYGDKAPFLMGYALDGKTRLLMIQDESGNMQMRCIFRILINSTNQKPVLLLEKPYVRTINAEELKFLNEQMKQFAQDRAKTLGLPLVTYDFSDSELGYGSDIESIGGRVPLDYVDCNTSSQISAKWQINKERLKIIYDPELAEKEG